MTTDNMDSNLSAGNDGSPSQSASEESVQRGSETVAVPKAKWDELERTIKRLDDETRSNKDRAVKKTNERLDKFEEYIPVLERVTALMEGGIAKADAINIVKAEAKNAENDETMAELRQLLKSGKLPQTLSSGNGSVSGGKVAEVAKEFGLDENSVEITQIYKQYGDSDDAEKAVLRLAAKRAKEPSASASTSIEGQPPQRANVEKLTLDYQKDMIAARGNETLVKQIKEDAKKKGVPVDDVVFL